jgi:hypothetical protein
LEGWHLSMSRPNRWLRAVLRIALMLLVGVLVALSVVLYDDRPDWVPSGRWLALIAYTVLVFGLIVRDFRESWNRATLWLPLTAMFVTHCAIYAAVLRAVTEWRSIWFLPISAAEFVVFGFVLRTLGNADQLFSRLIGDGPEGENGA